ncbi:MAG: FHIPEP family type III secretion protein [Lachnospiraceae bacterium]|nr:FHIPEP family type III secretion protein [Lachnospiraceae bacterium]
MNYAEIGNRISRCRQNRNMTQEELAGRIGVTPQAVSKWERGQSIPDTILLADLCQVLGVSAGYLLGIEGQEITENGDSKAQNEIWKNLRNCLEPLELIFGKELVPAFMDNSYEQQVVTVRKNLSREGILMPLVRVRDELQLRPREFMILSYQKVLHAEEIEETGEDARQCMMDRLEEIVRQEYADILNCDMVKELVDNLQIRYPVLVQETVPERISYGQLTDVCKKFMERGNRILYLAKILEIVESSLRQNPDVSVNELVEVLEEKLDREDNFSAVLCRRK